MDFTKATSFLSSKLLLLLRLSTFLCLFCRGWLYLRWGNPLREFFWREKLWWDAETQTGAIDYFLHLDWETYAATSDPYITFLIRLIGILMMAGGVLALFVRPNWRRCMDYLLLMTAFTMLHAYGKYFGKNEMMGMLFEYLLQGFSPLILWLALRNGIRSRAVALLTSIAAALTFVGHGLFAIGFYPVPHNFVNMGMNILGLSEQGSKNFLLFAGYLDFLLALLIFFPARWVRVAALAYMVFWGFVTAMARIANHITPTEDYYGIDPWLAETLVRTPHWILPLLLLLLCFRPTDERSEATQEPKSQPASGPVS